MNTRILTSVITLLLAVSSLFGQAKKYALLEHFTNTRCGVCASRNPAFYTTIGNYTDVVHHISIHPPIPYTNCLLYQANKEHNDIRKTYYGVFATPTVYLNGKFTGNPLITVAALDAFRSATSPIAVVVSENSGINRTANISIKSFDTAPSGDIRLFVAAVEKRLDYVSPNGERVHHDVLRKFLTPLDGQTLTLATPGNSVIFDFSYSVESGWKESEMYVIAWVQDYATKEVFNSGTRFDPPITSNVAELEESRFRFSPNPVKDWISFASDLNEAEISIYSVDGKILKKHQLSEGKSLNINHLPKGIYLLKIRDKEGELVKKFVKN